MPRQTPPHALVGDATDESVRPRTIGALLGVAGVGTVLGLVVGACWPTG